jgi:hypothetical protein
LGLVTVLVVDPLQSSPSMTKNHLCDMVWNVECREICPNHAAQIVIDPAL